MGIRIADLDPAERPRERLMRLGPPALRDDELLALLLGTGGPGKSSLDVARGLLERCGARELVRMPAAALCRAGGLGPGRACAIAAARELVHRWDLRAADGAELTGPRQVWEHLHGLRHERKEHFVALYLSARNRLLHTETVSIGTLTASLVHPREVFGPAVERAAAGVIVAHNHPSGEARPSPEDRAATARLERAGRILGVPLLDHVVVADGGFFSFREDGGLKP
ncbi:MAG: DNA repair protein RadC [Elusimicrobia bacterium]|nr:DNA repair protein RadC [Elusimicrobiota bacterium]